MKLTALTLIVPTKNEDTELIWRLQRNGYRIEYDKRLKVYEFDHRRLDGGMLQKTVHSLIRGLLLLCGLKMLLRGNDWGYWNLKINRKATDHSA
jgi:hypothetical protein